MLFVRLTVEKAETRLSDTQSTRFRPKISDSTAISPPSTSNSLFPNYLCHPATLFSVFSNSQI